MTYYDEFYSLEERHNELYKLIQQNQELALGLMFLNSISGPHPEYAAGIANLDKLRAEIQLRKSRLPSLRTDAEQNG